MNNYYIKNATDQNVSIRWDKAKEEADKNGYEEINEGVYLNTSKELTKEQKDWPEDDESKHLNFSIAPYWITDAEGHGPFPIKDSYDYEEIMFADEKQYGLSLDNGLTFTTDIREPNIAKEIREKWDNLTNLMNDRIREEIHMKLSPCSELDFLEEYLSYESLVLG